MKSYKDYCLLITMNVRPLILTLSIAFAVNSACSAALNNELAIANSPFSKPQKNLLKSLSSILHFYQPLPFPTSLSNEIEYQVENEIEDEVEDDIKDEVEDEIEDEVEDDIEDEVEDEIEDEVEDEIEDDVEDEIENDVEDDIEDDVEDDIEGEVKDEIDDEIENNVDDESEDMLLALDDRHLIDRLTETTIEQVDEQLSNITRLEDEKVYSDDWFVLSDKTSFDLLKDDGFSISEKEYLVGLDLYLAKLQAPKSFDLKPENYNNLMALNTSNRAIDVNHLYELAQNSSGALKQTRLTKTTKKSQNSVQHRIGMIDSGVNQSHPALLNSQIITRQFAEIASQNVYAHGTAVASILVGQAETYQGMLPGQALWSATVVFNDQAGSQLATTISLVRALDWLIQSGVDIINMSLTGPDNKLLQIAIGRACSQHILVVAAAGNNGPSAKPQYPAAYACTVAVTAIDSHNQIYRRAARGEHIDLSAYGVNILHADATNSFHESSGTSFAAPLISGWLANNMPHEIKQRQKWLKNQMLMAEDLGAVGKDPIYGFGTLKIHPGRHLADTQYIQHIGVP